MGPDLHHKMSKKIAQLTKVIYHLNTVNEDNAYDIEQRASEQQEEIATILKDAGSKINRFRDLIEERKVESNEKESIEQVKRKFKKEKENAIGQLKTLKEKMKGDQEELREECREKIFQLKDEIGDCKEKLKNAVSNFEQKEQTMRRQFEANKGVASDEVEHMRKKHELECADIVRSHNEKFNQMLVEQMTLQNTIKSTIEGEKKKELEEILEVGKKELLQLRKQLLGEREKLLAAKIEELNGKFGLERSELLKGLEKAVGEVGKAKKVVAEVEVSERAKRASLVEDENTTEH